MEAEWQKREKCLKRERTGERKRISKHRNERKNINENLLLWLFTDPMTLCYLPSANFVLKIIQVYILAKQKSMEINLMHFISYVMKKESANFFISIIIQPIWFGINIFQKRLFTRDHKIIECRTEHNMHWLLLRIRWFDGHLGVNKSRKNEALNAFFNGRAIIFDWFMAPN